MQSSPPVNKPGERLAITGMTIVPGPRRAVVNDGAIIVQDGKIEAIGTAAELAAQIGALPRLDARGMLVVPGLINAHSHAPMGFFRGLTHPLGSAPAQKAGGNHTMIEDIFYPTEKRLTPELMEPLCYSYFVDGLKSGVTCFNESYFFTEGTARAAERLGLRAMIGEHIADLGGAFDAGHSLWQTVRSRIDDWRFSDRVRPIVYAHAADTVSRPLLKEVAQFAKDRRLPFHMHLAQSRGERERVERREGMSPVRYADACGALIEGAIYAHLIAVDDDDCRLLGERGALVGLCAASEILYEELPPIARLAEHGLRFAVGTDCAASNDGADLMAELRLVALLAKQAGLAIDARSPSELLAMVTTHPARSFGLPGGGELAAGAAADMVFLEIDIGAEPMTQPLVNFVYSLGSRHVRHVMIAGEWALWRGATVKVSEADLVAAYRSAVTEIKKRAGLPL